MKKGFRIALTAIIPLFLISCLSIDNESEQKLMNNEDRIKTISESADFNSIMLMNWLSTMPEANSPIFFAYTSRLSYRENELPKCLLNAASQASKFNRISAVSEFYSKQVNSSIRYASDLDIRWDRELEADLLDYLEIIETIQDHDGTYMRVRLMNAEISPYINYKREISPDEPSWILNPPEIPGYIVGVGTVLQNGYMARSFEAADNQALEEIARQVSVSSTDSRKLLENSSGTASINDNIERSEAEITGFYVIERWYSPDKRYFHSLAVAPAENRMKNEQ